MHTIAAGSASRPSLVFPSFLLHLPGSPVSPISPMAALWRGRLPLPALPSPFSLVISRPERHLTRSSRHDVFRSPWRRSGCRGRCTIVKRAVNDGTLPQCWTMSQATKLGSHDSPKWGSTQGQVAIHPLDIGFLSGKPWQKASTQCASLGVLSRPQISPSQQFLIYRLAIADPVPKSKSVRSRNALRLFAFPLSGVDLLAQRRTCMTTKPHMTGRCIVSGW